MIDNGENVRRMASDAELQDASREVFLKSCEYKYSYNFTWLGVPIIQYPQDVMAVQELIWRVRPRLIVETGVAHGGSLLLSASLLELIGGPGRVVGVDVDIRPENRAIIESHPLSRRIELIQGSSIDEDVVRQVKELASGKSPVMVFLDSNHTHDHVLKELESYSPVVTPGSYLVVFDTIVEHMPKSFFPNRPWGPGDNPLTAVRRFLTMSDRFVVDQSLQDKLLWTVAPEGYLLCVKP